MTRPIFFLLPVRGGSGGAHSVMQEAEAMWNLGAPVSVLVNAGNESALRSNYSDMPRISQHIIGYRDVAHLRSLISERNPLIVIATINDSAHVLASAVKDMPGIRTGYYVQDYEPFFYPPDSDLWRAAYTSYGIIPGMLHFAKTRWLQEMVQQNHGISVVKVAPSIDHGIYFPNFARLSEDQDGQRLNILAMVRPDTPRRAPHRHVRILNQVVKTFGDRVQISVFGGHDEDLAVHQLHLDPAITSLGILRREEVGQQFRVTDVFLDLSDYQAFGRTAVEAMSCGAIAVVPAHGGAHEFATDGQNAFIVDTRYDDLILKTMDTIMAMSAKDRLRLRLNAVRTGFEYSVEGAALSELNCFFDM